MLRDNTRDVLCAATAALAPITSYLCPTVPSVGCSERTSKNPCKVRFSTVLLGSGGLLSPDVLLPPKLSLCTGFPSHPHLPEILFKLFLDSVLCDGDTCSVSPADVSSFIAIFPICKESEA